MQKTMVQPVSVSDAVVLFAEPLETPGVTGKARPRRSGPVDLSQAPVLYADVAHLTRVRVPISGFRRASSVGLPDS